MNHGFVSIVAASPGSKSLLTLKAVEVIRSAEVILFDALVSKEVQELFPAGVMALYCGKRCGDQTMSQKEINRFMIRLARRGKHVVCLKGGDPFVYGSGGEEAIALRQHNIAFDVITGGSPSKPVQFPKTNLSRV